MNLIVALYSAILFFVLSPNIFLRLPAGGSKMMVAGVHALVFAAVLYFTQKFVWQLSMRMEGMEGMVVPSAPGASDIPVVDAKKK